MTRKTKWFKIGFAEANAGEKFDPPENMTNYEYTEYRRGWNAAENEKTHKADCQILSTSSGEPLLCTCGLFPKTLNSK